jgi:serine/threonine-protein kinase
VAEPSNNATGAETGHVARGSSLLGRRVDKYEVVRFLGRGGMGCVYEAVNTTINKRVAIKCIDHALAMSPDAKARFAREAMAASAAESPYIVQIFDTGATEEGLPYMVMELLHGEDLGSLLTEVGRLDVTEAMAVTAQILKGLHHAHKAGVVHRDLKPDNVFLVAHAGEPASVKLLDFGVSKMAKSSDVPLETLTREGTVVGTPYYMSPEQAQSFPDVDGRADLYSCAAILYECLCGRPPHVGQSYEQVIVNICMKDAEDVRAHNPAVPEAVATFLKRALARAREERFQTARDMLDALVSTAPESIAAHTPARIHIATLPTSGDSPTPRRPSDPRELADTVRAATTPILLGDSGERPVSRPSDGATLPSHDLQAIKRRRATMIGGAALLIGIGGFVMLGPSRESKQGAERRETHVEHRETHSATALTGEGVAPKPPSATATETTAPVPIAPPPSSASAVQPANGRPVASVRPPPPPTAQTALVPPPPPPPEGLQILPR